MVVWRKQVPSGDTGDSTHVGTDDWNVNDKYHGNVDVSADLSNPTQIATPTTFNTSILKIGNGTNSNKVTFTSSAQTGNFNINIPVLSSNIDLPISASGAALTGSANTFTAIQTISSDNQRVLKLYRPANTVNNIVGIEFDHQNSTPAQTEYGRITTKVITNTAAAEFGQLEMSVVKNGAITKVVNVDAAGMMMLGSSQNIAVGGYVKNSGISTTTASTNAEFDLLNYTVPGNLLGSNGCLAVRIAGYILQNQVTATTYTWKIKFGTTTCYQAGFSGVAQSSVNKPYIFEFVIGNLNATNSQRASGKIMVQDNSTTTLTTGEGSIEDDEQISNANFRSTDPAKDTTSNQTLQATMTMSVNDANVQTNVQRVTIEFIPGI